MGYVEPSSYASSSKLSKEASILGTTPTLQEFIVPEKESFKAFGGSGNKLKKQSGLTRQLKQSTLASDEDGINTVETTVPLNENEVPVALNLPEGRLFFGYPVKEKKKDSQDTPAFKGDGKTLRSSRNNVN